MCVCVWVVFMCMVVCMFVGVCGWVWVCGCACVWGEIRRTKRSNARFNTETFRKRDYKYIARLYYTHTGSIEQYHH